MDDEAKATTFELERWTKGGRALIGKYETHELTKSSMIMNWRNSKLSMAKWELTHQLMELRVYQFKSFQFVQNVISSSSSMISPISPTSACFSVITGDAFQWKLLKWLPCGAMLDAILKQHFQGFPRRGAYDCTRRRNPPPKPRRARKLHNFHIFILHQRPTTTLYNMPQSI
jgi:hypothetical protein